MMLIGEQTESIDGKQLTLHKFKVFDISTKSIFIESYIEYKPLIGRLTSGLYTFVDGHIYYSNNVIKLRYDLIANNKFNITYKENEIFDYYYNIFPI